MRYLAGKESITTDEKVHVPAGYSYWKFRDFRMNPEHPPLAKLFVGLPLYLKNIQYPDTSNVYQKAGDFYYDNWQETREWGEKLFYQSGNDAGSLIYSARFVNIILGVLLIILITYICYKFGGLTAAAIGALLSSFQPIFLAHNHLANTETAVALFSTGAFYALYKYLKLENRKWLFLTIIFFALAIVSKYTAVIFLPIVTVLLLVKSLKSGKFNLKSASIGFLLFIVITWLVLLIVYGFKLDIIPTLTEATRNSGYAKLSYVRFLAIPGLFFKGLFMITGHAIDGHPSFLLGQFSKTGWWYYFPVALILKTPTPFLILFGITAANIKKLLRNNFYLNICLLVAIFGFLAVAMFSKTNIGVRHLMPIFPFMIIFVSQLATISKSTWVKILVVILILWQIISVSFNFKNQIAYFNDFIGSKNGYKYLSDSNFDWGQNLIEIKKYIEKNNIKNYFIQYFWESTNEREYCGLGGERLTDFNFERSGQIFVDSITYQDNKYSWLRNLSVIDFVNNNVFVLEYLSSDTGMQD